MDKKMSMLIEKIESMPKQEQYKILNFDRHDSYQEPREIFGDLFTLVEEVDFHELRDELLKRNGDIYFQTPWVEAHAILENHGFKKVLEPNSTMAIFADRSRGLIAYAIAYFDELNSLKIHGQLKGDSSELPLDFRCHKINGVTSFDISGVSSLPNGTGIMKKLELITESGLEFLPKWENKEHSLYFAVGCELAAGENLTELTKKRIKEAQIEDIVVFN